MKKYLNNLLKISSELKNILTFSLPDLVIAHVHSISIERVLNTSLRLMFEVNEQLLEKLKNIKPTLEKLWQHARKSKNGIFEIELTIEDQNALQTNIAALIQEILNASYESIDENLKNTNFDNWDDVQEAVITLWNTVRTNSQVKISSELEDFSKDLNQNILIHEQETFAQQFEKAVENNDFTYLLWYLLNVIRSGKTLANYFKQHPNSLETLPFKVREAIFWKLDDADLDLFLNAPEKKFKIYSIKNYQPKEAESFIKWLDQYIDQEQDAEIKALMEQKLEELI